MTECFNSINIPERLYPDQIYRISELELKIDVLEKIIKELVAKQPINIEIEKICIHRIDTDKIELKLDDVDVKKLCGMLKINVETETTDPPAESAQSVPTESET